MRKFNLFNQPKRKVSIKELSKGFTEKDWIEDMCDLIHIGVFDLDDMKWLLIKEDYLKLYKAYELYTVAKKREKR